VPVENSIVVVLTRWGKILEIDTQNLTATVQPGVVTGVLQKEVEKYDLFYPPDPGSSNVCTIGGNVANNAGGLRGLKYGVTKNYVLGTEIILPSGELLKSGGKNMKDVAGYNLRDFIVGSEGTLGIITKILLKLIPKFQKSITVLAYFDRLSDSGKSVSDIIASHITPSMMEFLDNTTINCVEDFTHVGLPRNSEAILLIEVDGRGSEVEEDANTVVSILKKNNVSFIKKAEDEKEALTLKNARRSAFSALARRRPTTILEDATVPRSELPVMIEKVTEAAKKFDVIFGNFGHAGDGNLHPTCLTDERDKSEITRAHNAFEFIFDEAIKLGGTITGEHGTGLAKKQFLEKATGIPAVDMMKKIKTAIDPNNVINPGKIFSISPRCEEYSK
jgi:glycolate oxidase